MSDQRAPENAMCAHHDGDGLAPRAAWICHRCGSFFCEACAFRMRPEAVPMCKDCGALRARKVEPVKKISETRLQTASLVLGGLSLVPIPALQLASLVLCIVAIAKAKKPPARDVRWKPIVGLLLTLAGMALSVVILMFANE